jgi:hypothetical protein
MLRLRIQPPWLPRLINRIIVQHLIWGCFFCFDIGAFVLFPYLHLHGWMLLVLPLIGLEIFAAGRIYRQVREIQQFPYTLQLYTAFTSTLGLIIMFFVWKFRTPYALIGVMHLFAVLIRTTSEWLGWKALRHDELVFTAKGIQFPDQWRLLRVPWKSVAHAGVKDDIFTLQLTDNRWWQWEICPDQDSRVSEIIRLLYEQLRDKK